MEINPLKVHEQMMSASGGPSPGVNRGVPPEQIINDPDVQAILTPRYVMLNEIAASFLDTILDSLSSIPYGIRWICKQIRNLTKRKYPEANEHAICSLVGAFFFLRFVNPAIVTPHGYMLVEGVPGEHPRRTLTLIAKLLQNLVNKPSFNKELYLEPLYPFVDANKARIDKFLSDICEVPDFYETLELDQYIALSKNDLRLDITLNEVYGTHALLEKHIAQLSSEPKSHLRILIQEIGAAPPQVLRSENRSIELPLFSRWETPITDITNSLDITQADILFMETKSVFVQIVRSLPQGSPAAHIPLNLSTVADTAASIKDAALVRRGIKALDMLRELADLRLVDPRDRYNPLTQEVEQELAHLGSIREKVIGEISSLQLVYKTICDHNDYLKGQLDTYRAYLLNVRVASGGGRAHESKSRGVGVVTVGGKEKKQVKQVLGPYKYTHSQLEKEGVIAESNVPDNR